MSCIILRLIDIKYSEPSYSAGFKRSEYSTLDKTALRKLLMERTVCYVNADPHPQSFRISTSLYVKLLHKAGVADDLGFCDS